MKYILLIAILFASFLNLESGENGKVKSYTTNQSISRREIKECITIEAKLQNGKSIFVYHWPRIPGQELNVVKLKDNKFLFYTDSLYSRFTLDSISNYKIKVREMVCVEN